MDLYKPYSTKIKKKI